MEYSYFKGPMYWFISVSASAIGTQSLTLSPSVCVPALSQIMLFVDGMNGVISHNETLQWLYTLTGSQVSLLFTSPPHLSVTSPWL